MRRELSGATKRSEMQLLTASLSIKLLSCNCCWRWSASASTQHPSYGAGQMPGSPSGRTTSPSGRNWARAMLELEGTQRLDKNTGFTRMGMRDLAHTPDVRGSSRVSVPTAARTSRARRPPAPPRVAEQRTSHLAVNKRASSQWGRRGEMLQPLSPAEIRSEVLGGNSSKPRTAPSRVVHS